MEEVAKVRENVSYDLTEGNIIRLMLRFAFPIFLGTLFQSLYIVADAVIIAKFSGKDALASIESVYTIIRIPTNLFTGLAGGACIIISQYFGAGRYEKVSDATHNAVLFAFFGGLLLSVAGCLFSPIAISFIQVPPEIAGDAKRYLLICFSGMALSMIYNMGSGILRALGNSKTPFYYLILANLFNIVLDLCFVAVFRLGVVGAAIATVLSQGLAAILIVFSLSKTDLPCKLRLKSLRFHRRELSELFRLGLPIGLQSTLYPVSNTLVQTSINATGVDSIAAWAICGKLDFLVWAISDAIASSVSTFVAQNFGAKKYLRARKGVRFGLLISLLSVAVLSLVLYFGSRFFAGFLVDDARVLSIIEKIMHFIAPLYVVFVFCDLFPGALRGIGDSFRPMLVTLFGTCVFRVFWVIFVVPLRPDLMTVLSCYPVSWGISAIALIVLYVLSFPKQVPEENL